MKGVKERVEPYVGLCKNIGAQYGIPPELLLAIIVQESSGKVGAIRYEPKYLWLHQPKSFALKLGISLQTEETAQRFSYGLTQIMLATARWLGFEGYPYELYEPTGNLTWCARFLSQLQSRHASLNDIIASYNAGSPRRDSNGRYVNQEYVDSVTKYMNYFKGSGILNAKTKLG